MNSSRRTVRSAWRTRSDVRYPTRVSSSTFCARSRRNSSGSFLGLVGGGMPQPSTVSPWPFTSCDGASAPDGALPLPYSIPHVANRDRPVAGRLEYARAEGSVCLNCRLGSSLSSRALGVCGTCILSDFTKVRSHIARVHARSRSLFGLPAQPPRERGGVRCPLCGNECVIGEGGLGFCGLRTVRNGRIRHLAGTPSKGLLTWYRDPLPTNCVADWICEGHRHPGDHNLAVFYESCTSDCLFCQNWHFRQVVPRSKPTTSAAELAGAANERTFCVCYFGGDPASQMPHALAASRLLAERGVRICWETAGTMHPKLMDSAVRL